jgi:integrase
MGLKMSKPQLRGGVYWFRKGVPKDLRPILDKREEKFSLRTRDPAEAKRLFLKAAAEIEERWARLRQGEVQLTHKQSLAIAGQIYREMIAENEDDPKTNIGGHLFSGYLLGKKDVKIIPIAKDQAIIDMFLGKMRERNERHNAGRIDAFLLREGYRLHSDSLNRLRRHVDEAIYHARGKINKMALQGDYSPDPQVERFPLYVSPTASKAEETKATPLLSAAINDWIAEKTRVSGKKKRAAWGPKTAESYELAARRFLELAGDRPLSEYKKKDAKGFKEAYLALPKTEFIKKQFTGLTFTQVVTKAKQIAAKAESEGTKLPFDCVDESTINKNIGFIQALWSWAGRNLDDVLANPFEGMKLTGQTDAVEQRDPFTTGELQTIFDGPPFTGCKSSKAWLTPGPHIPWDQGIYWVPLIGLFTGARSGEIIQMEVDDLVEQRGVLHFEITARRKGQKVKSKNAVRKIPVHSMLIKLGIREFAAKQRDKGTRLFPEFPRAADGHYSTAYSPRFGRLLKRRGIKTDKNSFHSFRHTFEDEALDSDIPVNFVNSLQGHSNVGMAGRYGSGKVRIKALHAEFEKVAFDELDFSRILAAQGRLI